MSLQCHGLPNREAICVVCGLSNFELEAWVACNGAKVVEGSDSRIEAEFVGVHVAGGTADNANKHLEVIFILEIVVLRDHPTSSIKEADIEDGTAECDVEE